MYWAVSYSHGSAIAPGAYCVDWSDMQVHPFRKKRDAWAWINATQSRSFMADWPFVFRSAWKVLPKGVYKQLQEGRFDPPMYANALMFLGEGSTKKASVRSRRNPKPVGKKTRKVFRLRTWIATTHRTSEPAAPLSGSVELNKEEGEK